MSQNWSKQQLDALKLTEVSPGVYQNIKQTKVDDNVAMQVVSAKKKLGRASLTIIPEELQDSHILLPGLNGCRITLTGLAAGLNGPKGLMQMQKKINAVKKLKEWYLMRLKALNCMSFGAPVIITYIRHENQFTDWDNHCASFKHIGDALQKTGIIVNDSPKFITEFIPKKIKCRKKEIHTEILIQYAK